MWSVSSLIIDSNIPKKTLIQDKFYNRISQQLSQKELKLSALQNGGIDILVNKIGIQDFVNPGILQLTTEKNIDNLTNFLDSKTVNFKLFLPTKEFQESEKSLETKIDKAVSDLKLTECSQKDLTKIKEKGWKIQDNLCLPATVIDGSESIINYLDENSKKAIQDLNQKTTNSTLDPITNKVNQTTTSITETANTLGQNFGNTIVTTIQFQKNSGLILSLVLIIILGILALLSRGYNGLNKSIFALFWSLIVGNITILITFGGFAYFGSFVKKLVLPMVNLEFLDSGNFGEILASEVFKITLNYLEYSFIFASILLLIWAVLKILGMIAPTLFEVKGELTTTKRPNNKTKKAKIYNDDFETPVQFRTNNTKVEPTVIKLNKDSISEEILNRSVNANSVSTTTQPNTKDFDEKYTDDDYF